MSRAALIAAVVCVAGGARANVWQRAVEHDAPDAATEHYDDAMTRGDQLAREANTKGTAGPVRRRQVELAVAAYKEAAEVKPNEGEPWYRIGKITDHFFTGCGEIPTATCDPRFFDHKHAAEVIAAWDEFEKRAPLDPRLSFVDGSGAEVLFERAILHTKMIDVGDAKAIRAHLEAAASDYQKIIKRIDSASTATEFYEEVVGNLAETFMMLDRLEESIDMYREALRHGGTGSTLYGLCVALDRDERGAEALERIRDLGEGEALAFHNAVMRHTAFFVPQGEVYYYYALIEEAFGRVDSAIDDWRLYIQSGAHPEYQPRAKAHLDALLAGHVRRVVPRRDLDDKLYFELRP